VAELDVTALTSRPTITEMADMFAAKCRLRCETWQSL